MKYHKHKLHRKGKVSLCLTKYHNMKTCWGSGGIAPVIFNLGSRWRWVVTFTLRPLYTHGKNHWYPLDRPSETLGKCGRKK